MENHIHGNIHFLNLLENGFFIKVIFTSISNDIYLKKYYSDILRNKLNDTVFFDCDLKYLKFVKYFKEKKYILLASIPNLKLKNISVKLKNLVLKKLAKRIISQFIYWRIYKDA